MLGPHFQYDLIRLARRGWPTWIRVLYLVVVLASLAILHHSQPPHVAYQELAEHAEQGYYYAITMIVLQDLLILLLLPVYVAGVVVEEREKRTIDALFLTKLTDREIALGKLGARLIPLAALVVAGVPLLAFLHLYGNIGLDFLLYHELNSLLMLLTGGSICLMCSIRAATALQAISTAFPFMLLLGYYGIVHAAGCPWMIGDLVATLWGFLGGGWSQPLPWYGVAAAVMVPFHGVISVSLLAGSVAGMEQVRLKERCAPRRLAASLALVDSREPAQQVRRKPRSPSYIHPLARTDRDNALFWKECLKDGTSWSLSPRWLLKGAGVVLALTIVYRLVWLGIAYEDQRLFAAMAAGAVYGVFFEALLVYGLLVLFQTTGCVAGEKEQHTLDSLLLIPDERPAILFYKWVGPMWRNWPVLAISYFAVLLGLANGLYHLRTALHLVLFPWPSLLMMSSLALCLSVICRRVIHANIVLFGCLAALLAAHVVAWAWLGDVVLLYIALFFETTLAEFVRISWTQALWMALIEQALFLIAAAFCAALAVRRFR